MTAEVATITWENGLQEDRVYGPGITAAAVFSPDRAYRYLLRRNWEPAVESMLFLMLNPSTANALVDDQTIRRCVHFARRQRYGGITVANLFALRSTDPRELLHAEDPAGPENWRILTDLADRAPGRAIVAAWGAYDRRLGLFGEQVTELFTERGHDLFRLGELTTGGYPRHPARLGNDVPIQLHAEGRPRPPARMDLVDHRGGAEFTITADDAGNFRWPAGEVSVVGRLKPCNAEGMCGRLVSAAVAYCCAPCGRGWEANPRHEGDHTPDCDARWAERRELVARG